MEPSAIIAALGGPAKVADRIGVKRTTVYGWRHQGIPARHWPCIVRLAARENVDGVTLEVLARRFEGEAA